MDGLNRLVEKVCELPMEKLGYAKYINEFKYSGKNVLVKDWNHIWPYLPEIYYKLRWNDVFNLHIKYVIKAAEMLPQTNHQKNCAIIYIVKSTSFHFAHLLITIEKKKECIRKNIAKVS